MSRTISLTDLAAVTPGGATIVGGGADIVVSGLAYDSRRVEPGCLFLAVPGAKYDGHDFLPQAVQAGAAAVVVQADRAERLIDLTVPRLVVPDVRAAMPALACRFYDNPTHRLHLTGVTGTNGKTTTVRLVDSIARAAGDATGVIGTLGVMIGAQELPGERTTPEAPDLQALFSQMLEVNVAVAAIEVASHALAQGRTDGCAFDIGIFTNLTQDHLDYHGSMDAYRDVKARLFTDYARTARAAGKRFVAVLNADDDAGRHYAAHFFGRSLVYSAAGDQAADIVAADIRAEIDRVAFTARTPIGYLRAELGFGGSFNVANALAAIGYGVARGLSGAVIERGLAECTPPPGRFQPVRAGQSFAVIVDYAHTPDGLANVLRSARPLTPSRLLVVFGCGGDRDRTKRPEMGRIAREEADIAVVTSDNPRGEDPEAIIDEIVAGMQGEGAPVHRETDRRAAIAWAVAQAQPGDTVVIAGKGHEAYQIIGDRTLPFDDVGVARKEIARCAR